ncbi:uncharacterized protein sh2d7 [Symphorus nematophorus]
MEKASGVDRHMEPSEGGLKELVLRWFTETQAPIVLNNGNFPDWFKGFAARKETEDLLRDKALGCFLIRLSDKAIGYILSYKGHDRCRHFVITQNPDGQFVIAGDCQTYGSLTELIEHYRVSPIQPFGEKLTSSCNEENTGELYDVVNYNSRGKSGVSVQALRTLWDQRNNQHSDPGSKHRPQQHNEAPAAPPPALPPKSKNRKLTETVSVDSMPPAQGVPPVPKRGVALGLSLSGSLPDTTSHESETEPKKPERLRGNTNPVLKSDSFKSTDSSYPGDLCPPGLTYSELTKKVTCHTYSLHDPRDGLRPSSGRSEQPVDDVEILRSNPLYHTCEPPGGGSAQQRGGGGSGTTYTEVPQRPTPAGLPDNTYEQIPGEAAAVQGNTYESLDDVKTKKSKSTWGKNNMNWKKFLPDYMKK